MKLSKISLSRVVEGWLNMLFMNTNFVSEEVKNEAKRRAAICKGCEFRTGHVCGACGCPIAAKSASMKEKCPKGFWQNSTDPTDNNNEEE